MSTKTTSDLFILNFNQGYFSKVSQELVESRLKHKPHFQTSYNTTTTATLLKLNRNFKTNQHICIRLLRVRSYVCGCFHFSKTLSFSI